MDNQTLSERIRIVDPSDLKADLDRWPELARRSWDGTTTIMLDSIPHDVVMAGMGGSGIVADIITDIARRLASKIRFEVINNYHLPESTPQDALVIGISCSGNTAETLKFVSEAEKAGIKGFAVSSGGKMEAFARQSKNFRHMKTEMLKVQRASFPGLIFPLLKMFSQNRMLDVSNDALEAMECMQQISKECSDPDSASNPAVELARKIVNGEEFFMPIVYGSRFTRAAGRRFRQSLNENAKIHAFSGEIPEICHNSIVAWDTASSLAANGISDGHHIKAIPVLLRFDEDPEEVKVRFDIIEQLLKESGVEPIKAPYKGASYLSKVISLIYYLEYVTYYVAILRGVNPIVTPSIDKLKSRLDAMGKGY
ncbi:MAG: hypothetical protein KGH60_02410 [Candidatus Micrarchaeota archaeon]|nr:hypothetical protein [Candidatus Micrarchaeota archaeon]